MPGARFALVLAQIGVAVLPERLFMQLIMKILIATAVAEMP
jgi:hypothetical protein